MSKTSRGPISFRILRIQSICKTLFGAMIPGSSLGLTLMRWPLEYRVVYGEPRFVHLDSARLDGEQLHRMDHPPFSNFKLQV